MTHNRAPNKAGKIFSCDRIFLQHRISPSPEKVPQLWCFLAPKRANLIAARDDFQAALPADPVCRSARTNLGAALLRVGDIEGSIADFREDAPSCRDLALALPVLRDRDRRLERKGGVAPPGMAYLQKRTQEVRYNQQRRGKTNLKRTQTNLNEPKVNRERIVQVI